MSVFNSLLLYITFKFVTKDRSLVLPFRYERSKFNENATQVAIVVVGNGGAFLISKFPHIITLLFTINSSRLKPMDPKLNTNFKFAEQITLVVFC